METLAAYLVAFATAQREGKKKLKLHDGDFSSADLSSIDLHGLTIQGTKVSPRQFYRAKFDNSNLLAATFVNVDLDDVSFKGANLSGAKFIGCLLVGADFTDATLSDVTFENCRLGRAKLPNNIRAKFKNSRLVDLDLSGRDLRMSLFIGCSLWGTRFDNCDLRGSRFEGCDTGSKTFGFPNFGGADLWGASMTLMSPLPVGMSSLTMGEVSYAAVRSSSGKINVWCEENEKWLSLDKAELPEKVAAILALMAEE